MARVCSPAAVIALVLWFQGVGRNSAYPEIIPATSGEACVLGGIADRQAGYSVAMGDCTGDGRADFIVGSYHAGKRGKAHVFLGPQLPTGLFDLDSRKPTLTFIGPEQADEFARAVAVADFDGDGVQEILFGAPRADYKRRQDCGAVFIFKLPATITAGMVIDLSQSAPALKPLSIIYGPTEFDALGGTIASGHFNSDRCEDIMIGAESGSNLIEGTARGSCFVVAGGPAPPGVIDLRDTPLRLLSLFHRDPLDGVGMTLASGDINADGFDDLIVGTPYSGPSFGESFKGKVMVLFGQPTAGRSLNLGLDPPTALTKGGGEVADLTFYGAHKNDRLGVCVVSGDINGDGIADLILGSVSTAGKESDPGVVNIFFGRKSFERGSVLHLSSTRPDVCLLGERNYDAFGQCLLVANLDGVEPKDLLIGAWSAGTSFPQEGIVYIIPGRVNWPETIQASTLIAGGAPAIRGAGCVRLGLSMAAADAVGDGRDDLLLGAPIADRPEAAMVGRIHFFRAEQIFPPAVPIAAAEETLPPELPKEKPKRSRRGR